MPIFEYVCGKCAHRFEQIVYGETTAVACPACQGRKVEKQLSVFSASHSERNYWRGGRPVAPCGSCGDPNGPGSCSTN